MRDARHILFLYSASFVPHALHAAVREGLPAHWDVEFVEQGVPAAQRLQAFRRADYLIAYPGDPTADELDAAARLKFVQLLSAGYDWLDLAMFRARGIAVSNNGGSNASSTAEHTVMLMLAMLKCLPLHDAAVRRGEWPAMANAARLRELAGKRVGIVGLGQIGREVARRVHAFGAHILYQNLEPVPQVERECGAQRLEWPQLLAASDILTLHLPLTPQTRGLVGAGELALMRPGSYLVNAARGALVDERALADALACGHLAGAALDVFVSEPLAASSPLRGLDNVVLTPHIGGVTLEAWRRRIDAARRNIERVEQGQPVESRIA